eukprot:7104662-Ditylum_brightwellii.AAC.1
MHQGHHPQITPQRIPCYLQFKSTKHQPHTIPLQDNINIRKYQSQKGTYNKDIMGYSGCQADAESTVNIIKQVMDHNENTCILLDNANIRDKSVR